MPTPNPNLCISCAFKYQSWGGLHRRLLAPTCRAYGGVRPFSGAGIQDASTAERQTVTGTGPPRWRVRGRDTARPRSNRHDQKQPVFSNFDSMQHFIMSRIRFLQSKLPDSRTGQGSYGDNARGNSAVAGFMASLSESSSDNLEHVKEEIRADMPKIEQAYAEGGLQAGDTQLRLALQNHIVGSCFTKADHENQKMLADLRYPTEWFPRARVMQRQIHLHVGPTNSGKTYHALKRLEQAGSGMYAGPLRLLAHEVYTRLNNAGKRCLLITGEERRSPDEEFGADLRSCTVEMVPLNLQMDVAVIDEIQMLGSADRGWAWTQALLGVQARELHLCGEERTVPLIRELAASMGDKLEIHKYERLSPLRMMPGSLGGRLNRLRKGDCVVCFSVMGIHGMRKLIEKNTGRKAAIVYGSLPPETRAQQARLFNDPNNEYDFLVASDAIGMGLNLSIKRIIFESVYKFDGHETQLLKISDIKQIAGRAGRYRSAEQFPDNTASQPPVSGQIPAANTDAPTSNLGLVTTLEEAHYPAVKAAMTKEPEPILTAGLFPPAPIVERFASYFPPDTPFSYILLRLHDIAQMHPRFHLCRLKDPITVADAIQPVKGLTTADRIAFCAAPLSTRDEASIALLRVFASCVAEQKAGGVLDFPQLPLEVLDRPRSAERRHLQQLETLHKGIILYLWLSYRFSGVFNTRALAFHVKQLVEDEIEEVLKSFDFTELARRRILAARERKLREVLKKSTVIGDDQAAEGPSSVDQDGAHASKKPNYDNAGSLYETREPLESGAFSDLSEPENKEESPELAIQTRQSIQLPSEEAIHQENERDKFQEEKPTWTPELDDLINADEVIREDMDQDRQSELQARSEEPLRGHQSSGDVPIRTTSCLNSSAMGDEEHDPTPLSHSEAPQKDVLQGAGKIDIIKESLNRTSNGPIGTYTGTDPVRSQAAIGPN